MYHNREITDLQTIADGFNNYFVNIGPTLASKIVENLGDALDNANCAVGIFLDF